MTAAQAISYIGREEHSSKDIAQVPQVEGVVEILLENIVNVEDSYFFLLRWGWRSVHSEYEAQS